MQAIILKKFGDVENLHLTEIPLPQIKSENEVLIQVKAIGIDQIDLKTRQGGGLADRLKTEDPMILGWDMAGVLVETGKDVNAFEVGDAVFGTVNFPGLGNTYAEYVVAPAADLAMKPKNISFEEAAAATQSPLTAWQALTEDGHVKKGDKVLIHGAAGGVGNFAVQIARQAGAYVIATAAGKDKDFVLQLGADEFIDYKTQQFDEIVKDVDLVLDTIGGENFARSLTVLKPEGTIVLLPSDKKAAAAQVAKEKNVKHYHPLLMHSSGENMKQIAQMLTDGSMKVYIHKTFPFVQLPMAHQAMEAGGHRGKIVVTV